MTFEEDFPSLKDVEFEAYDETHVIYQDEELQEIFSRYCLDKQKVREAIKKTLDAVNEQIGPRYPEELMAYLTKELGL